MLLTSLTHVHTGIVEWRIDLGCPAMLGACPPKTYSTTQWASYESLDGVALDYRQCRTRWLTYWSRLAWHGQVPLLSFQRGSWSCCASWQSNRAASPWHALVAPYRSVSWSSNILSCWLCALLQSARHRPLPAQSWRLIRHQWSTSALLASTVRAASWYTASFYSAMSFATPPCPWISRCRWSPIAWFYYREWASITKACRIDVCLSLLLLYHPSPRSAPP